MRRVARLVPDCFLFCTSFPHRFFPKAIYIFSFLFFFVCLLTNVDCLDTLALAMPKRKSPLGESKREMQKVFKSIAHLNKNYGRVARLPGEPPSAQSPISPDLSLNLCQTLKSSLSLFKLNYLCK